MRVLWLTHLQLPAATGDTSMVFGGWLEGLRSALADYEPDIELGIASTGPVSHEPFTRGAATYFSLPVPPANGRAQRALEAWRMEIALRPDLVEAAVAVAAGFQPDIVHVHGTEHFLGLAALHMPFPSLATLQGIASVYERFVLDAYSWSDVARSILTRDFVRGSSLLHAQASMRRRAEVERRIIRGLGHFMGQTEWDRNVLKLLNPTAEYYHTECIMQQDFYKHEWRQPKRPVKTVYCTSSAAPYKGLEMLIEAASLLTRAGYEGLRLRIAGPIPDSTVWPPLSRLARERGVGSLITWLGPLPATGLIKELQDCDVYVLPSHIENQPNSLLEAMLLGVPCVAAAVGGVPELVQHGVSGLIYHDSDPFALAASVARLLDDPQLARLMGEAARTQSRGRYDREAVAHRTREIYEQVLGS